MRGGILFFGDAGCASCHGGPELGGLDFANVGAPQIGPGGEREPPLDLGVAETLADDEIGTMELSRYRFAFRVPSLRNVELTAPYMHSGAYATLEAVVRHYDDVRRAVREYDVMQLRAELRDQHHGDEETISSVLATLDPRVDRRLRLTDAQVGQLVAFLGSLTDPHAADLGRLVPSGVPSGLPVVH